MNIIHLKYAVEVAKVGSINKASENLGMAQPNISRAIKDLEADMKVTIFDRSAKGMNLTPEGKEFINYAQKVLYQLNELENMYKGISEGRQKFSLSAPRSGYIAEAFSKFSRSISKNAAEISFDETGARNTIKNVVTSDCKLGIIRYEESADRFFKEALKEKELEFENIADFDHVILTSKNSPIAELDEIYECHLKNLIQITHASPYAATVSASDDDKDEPDIYSERCIYILDSAAQLELLSENPRTFMWVAPSPHKLCERYGLIQKRSGLSKRYRDVLIYRKDHKLTELDLEFIKELRYSAKVNLK